MGFGGYVKNVIRVMILGGMTKMLLGVIKQAMQYVKDLQVRSSQIGRIILNGIKLR